MTELSATCSRCGKKLFLTQDAAKVPVEHPDIDQALGLDPSPGISIPMTFIPELMESAWQWLESRPCPSCGARGTLERTA
jgi:ribosomal protein S27AE